MAEIPGSDGGNAGMWYRNEGLPIHRSTAPCPSTDPLHPARFASRCYLPRYQHQRCCLNAVSMLSRCCLNAVSPHVVCADNMHCGPSRGRHGLLRSSCRNGWTYIDIYMGVGCFRRAGSLFSPEGATLCARPALFGSPCTPIHQGPSRAKGARSVHFPHRGVHHLMECSTARVCLKARRHAWQCGWSSA